ncbi:hypothetical protein [Paenibacillus alvei]|uniref:hypothetical protein n=1 Tax=Paenibacillus alvei TaxID=44250 RepID=UPI00227DA54C|nr:hypothetical protein [Paenibacillus alvei]MCY7483075.1 hypothetical protein [Paenibacillus alvei]
MSVRHSKLAWGIALILLITNLITIGCLMTEKEKEKEKEAVVQPTMDVFELEGQSEHWQLRHYQVMRTPNSIRRGSATLTYLGDTKDIKDSSSFYIEYYEKHGELEEGVLTSGMLATNGRVHILSELDHLGSIQRKPTEFERSMTKDDFAGSYVKFRWSDSYGEEHVELIELEVNNHTTFK